MKLKEKVLKRVRNITLNEAIEGKKLLKDKKNIQKKFKK